jgi:hypothetical protein
METSSTNALLRGQVLCPVCSDTTSCIGTGKTDKDTGLTRWKYECNCTYTFEQLPPRDALIHGLKHAPVLKGKPRKCKLCNVPRKGHVCTRQRVNRPHIFKKGPYGPRNFVSPRKRRPQQCSKCKQFGHKSTTCQVSIMKQTYYFSDESDMDEPEPLVGTSHTEHTYEQSQSQGSPTDIMTPMPMSEAPVDVSLFSHDEFKELMNFDIECDKCGSCIGVLQCECKMRNMCFDCNGASSFVECPY